MSEDDGLTWIPLSYINEAQTAHSHSTVVVGGEMFMYGGLSIARGYSNDVWKSPDGLNWQKQDGTSGSRPSANFFPIESRDTISALGKLWVFSKGNFDIPRMDQWDVTDGQGSGPNGQRGELIINGVYSSSDDGFTWDYEGTSNLTNADTNIDRMPRYQDRYFFFNGKFRLIGRLGGQSVDSWSSVDGFTWVRTSDNDLPDTRTDFSLCEHLGEMFFMGGQDEGDENIGGAAYEDVWKSVDGEAWTLVPQVVQSDGQTSACAISFDDGGGQKIFIVGV